VKIEKRIRRGGQEISTVAQDEISPRFAGAEFRRNDRQLLAY
jgi:hypothetical protein